MWVIAASQLTKSEVFKHVCMYACISQETRVTSPNCLYMLPVAWTCCGGVAKRYVLMILMMTSCFPVMDHRPHGGMTLLQQSRGSVMHGLMLLLHDRGSEDWTSHSCHGQNYAVHHYRVSFCDI